MIMYRSLMKYLLTVDFIILNLIDGFIINLSEELECPTVRCLNGGKLDKKTCVCYCTQQYTGWTCGEPEMLTKWPNGKYSIPSSLFGCPEEGWDIGYISLTVDYNYFYWTSNFGDVILTDAEQIAVDVENKEMHIFGHYSNTTLLLNFCTRNDVISVHSFQGNFCTFKVGTGCSLGYTEGSLFLDNYDAEIRGTLPNVTINGGVMFTFCCSDGQQYSNNSESHLYDSLPKMFPFVFLKGQYGDKCDVIDDMNVTEDTLYLPKNDKYETTGILPYIELLDNHIGMTFCVYLPDNLFNVPVDSSIASELVSEGKEVYISNITFFIKEFMTLDPNLVVDGGFNDRFHYTKWIQVSLQESIKVNQIQVLWASKMHMYLAYVSVTQWDFRRNVSVLCSMLQLSNKQPENLIMNCLRPQKGRYVTFYNRQFDTEYVNEIKIYGERTGCGRRLGMISGDIKEFQIEVSSNEKDIRFARGFNFDQAWCPLGTDQNRWIMVDLIIPTVAEGIAIHGTKNLFIESFKIEYGVTKNNMKFYSELNNSTMVFKIDKSIESHILQEFWFWNKFVARYFKVVIVEPTKSVSCLKIEILGCAVQSRRTIGCTEYENRMDFGFAVTPYTGTSIQCQQRQHRNYHSCLKRTIDFNFVGNQFEHGPICCLYNISSISLHLRHEWHRTDDDKVISERLCYSKFQSHPVNERQIYNLSSLPGQKLELYSPFYPSGYGQGVNSETLVTSSTGFIKITVVHVSLSESTSKDMINDIGYGYMNPGRCNDTLIIDIGSDHDIVITRMNQTRYTRAIFISQSSAIVVKFTSCFHYFVTTGNMFILQMETADYPGCGVDETQQVTCNLQTAYLQSYLYPTPFIEGGTHFWKIRGIYGQYIEFVFIDFEIKERELYLNYDNMEYFYTWSRYNSYVEVFDLTLTKNRTSVGRFTGIDVPHVSLKSSWHMMDIELRAGKSLLGRGFSGWYRLVDTSVKTDVLNITGCHHNWKSYQDQCIELLYSDQIDHRLAEQECKKYNGHLVTIETKHKMEFVQQLAISMSRSHPILEIYIGLTKAGRGENLSDFRWLSGDPMLFTSWHKDTKTDIHQPDGYNFEQCTAIILDSILNTQIWHDVPCAYNNINYFMCETKQNISEDKDPVGTVLLIGNETLFLNIPEYTHQCTNGEFISKYTLCDDCYLSSLVCTGTDSDVKTCHYTDCDRPCSSSEFRCGNGQCIHLNFYCDGIDHCDDATDENKCVWSVCENDEWQCDSKHCIPATARCDVKMDCSDGSDEQQCEKCSDSSFQCFDKTCLATSRVCDKFPDCNGMYKEDEDQTCLSAYVFASCEDWWKVGVRSDGIVTINDNSGGHSGSHDVLCKFKRIKDMVMVSTLMYHTIESAIDDGMFLGSSYRQIMLMYPVTHGIGQMLESGDYACHMDIYVYCFGANIEEFGLFLVYPGDNCTQYDWYKDDHYEERIDSLRLSEFGDVGFDSIYVTFDVFISQGYIKVRFGPLTCVSEFRFMARESSISLCKSGTSFNTRNRCILDFDVYGDVIGCRDLTHLNDCGSFDCPRGFLVCPEGHCLSPRLVCDGIKHCSDGFDETYCANLTCRGLYRCRKSTTCLLRHEICDGVKQCPGGDDEISCNDTCPGSCVCDGLVYACNDNDINSLPYVPYHVRKLNMSGSSFKNNILLTQNHPLLAQLILSYCSIAVINPMTFKNLKNLLHLDLSYNLINSLYENTFSGLLKLEKINIEGNHLLRFIEPNTFVSLQNVKELQLIGTNLDRIQYGSFNGLEKLEILNISGNGLATIDNNVFEGLNLIDLDISSNNIVEFPLDLFSGLEQMSKMKTDNYIFCCIRPPTMMEGNCYPPKDLFSSCDDLLQNDLMRASMWVIGTSAFFGNIAVIFQRIIHQRSTLNTPYGLFIMNLSISDMIMGIYVYIISVADVIFRGKYILHDKYWRDSFICKVAGVLSTLSSEMSVNFIMIISFQRFIVTKLPMTHTSIIDFKMAKLIVLVTWCIVLIMSIVPLFATTYFSDSFYTKTSVCLALPFGPKKIAGWEYTAAIFVFYNVIVFMVVSVLYLLIYQEAKSSNRPNSNMKQNDVILARRLFLVVFTDLVCWFPVGILGILSLTGRVFESAVYTWIAVFALPVNAALNPFLYTFSKHITEQSEKIASRISSFRRQRSNKFQKDFKTEIEVSSIFVERKEDLYLDYTTLAEFILSRKITPKECYYILRQITLGICFLHQKNVTMRTKICPDNVFIFMSKNMLKVRLVSHLLDIETVDEMGRDVEHIGIITKLILRRIIPIHAKKYGNENGGK